MKDFLHHLFIPRESNNHRAKVLHHQSLLFLIILLFVVSILVFPTIKTQRPDVLGISYSITNKELLEITNKKREEQGLPHLILNEQLSQAASDKAAHMFLHNYWAHNSPDGTTPWRFIKGTGYKYVYAGENLARGFTTSEDVVNAWMASPSHRENMLSRNYQEIGFAVKTGRLNGEETVLVVEMFGGEKSDSIAQKPGQIDAQGKQIEVVFQPQTFGISMNKQPLIDSISLSKNLGIILILFVLIELIIDMIIIERNKIIRLVGHNLDHIFFFGGILLIILIISKGVVL